MKTGLIAGIIVLVVVVVGYLLMNQKPKDTPVAAPAPAAAPEMDWPTRQAAFLAENAAKPGWQSTASGIQYIVLQPAATPGPKPAPGSEVKVHYEGRLIDGKVFDSSYARGEPISFPLTGVIPGWQEGVPLMRVGETWEFAIPANLAYGERGAAGVIPPGSALIFKIELLEAKTPAP